MSLEPRSDDGVPQMTARVVRAAFPKGTLAIRVREVLGPVFDDAAFSEAFPSRGRPAISPGALALVSVLQYAEGLSDRQAADQVRGCPGTTEDGSAGSSRDHATVTTMPPARCSRPSFKRNPRRV
jgi:hypothetical protein